MAGNNVYVVTGGNRGLGLGMVKELLARPSTTVIATVRNGEAEASLKAEKISPGEGSKLHVVVQDFTTAPSPDNFRAAVTKEVGDVNHIDVLVNNAGMCPTMAVAAQTAAEDMRAAYETNAIAPLMVFQAVWPLLQNAASPKLINVSSSVGGISSQEPVPGGAYGPSKAALNWLTRALHLQNAGLTAVALHPGWVQTRNGDFVAKEWNYAPGPPDTVEKSVKDMLNIIDDATRESVGGKFVTQTGHELPW